MLYIVDDDDDNSNNVYSTQSNVALNDICACQRNTYIIIHVIEIYAILTRTYSTNYAKYYILTSCVVSLFNHMLSGCMVMDTIEKP